VSAVAKTPASLRVFAVIGAAALLGLLLMPFGLGAQAAAKPPLVAAIQPHVLMVLMENTSYEQIVGNASMPFVNAQVAANGSVSTTDLSHPSLPNYLGLVSGSIQNNPPDTTPQDGTYAGPQFTDSLASAGIAWKAYMEDMPVACDLTDQFGPANYDVNHNPFMYFNSVRNNPAQCNRDVPYPQLTADLNAGTAPPFIWVSPNIINDMHNGTPAQGDAFLQGLVNQVKASSWWTGTPGSRIVITWDEGASTEQVLTLVIGSAHGTAANGGNEYGTLRGLEEAYGVPLLGSSASTSVGDILPLLAGAAPPPPPPPSPSPSPSPSPTPTPTALPSPSPSTSPGPSPSPVPAPSAGTRGIFRYTSTDYAAMHAAGFNASTDGGVQDGAAAQAANGIKGMVWVPAYDNNTCAQTLSNAAVAAMVQANVSAGYSGLRYEIGDEPTAFGCNAAAVYASITQAVHGADPAAKTWVADDQFQVGNPVRNGVTMKGTVDILAFDVYPCESGPCDYSAIDSAVQQIHAAGLTNWEFIIQDFSASPWRWPTPTEIQAQFDHWKNQGAIGYWVYAWDYLGAQMINQPGNVAAVQSINSQSINGSGSPSPSPSPTPTPSPTSTPSPSPSSTPTTPLSASGAASPTSGSAPLAVSFTGSGSGGLAPYSFAWNFNDGGTSTSRNPSHTYTGAGTYTATVVVTDARGVQASASTAAITVRSTLVASTSGSPTSGDVPVTVSFNSSATGGAGSYTYSWAFGDGATSTTQNPNHVYAAAGSYTPTVTVTDSAGVTAKSSVNVAVAPEPTLIVAANPSAADVHTNIAFTSTLAGGTSPFGYTWDFGDGSTSRNLNPTHSYASTGVFTVQLTVLDGVGHMANASLAVTVNPPPSATASSNITTGDAPLTINLSGLASSGTPTYTYAWSFGDGATSHGVQNPSHLYGAAGTYTAVFTATDASGQSASANVVITVHTGPVATANASPISGSAPVAVNFTASVSGGVAPYGYQWTFADGATGNTQNPSHTYVSAGIFTATLTVTDAVGGKVQANVGPISVSGPLSARAGAAPTAGDAPVTAAFFGSASGGTLPYSFTWSLGDGTTSNAQNPSHLYVTAGTYTATLTVTDAQNHSAAAQATVDVSPTLTASDSVSPGSGTAPLPVAFTANTSGGKAPFSYRWAFGDGATSISQNPAHSYGVPGTFTVSLMVTDANGSVVPVAPLTVNVAAGPLVASAASATSSGDAPMAAALSGSLTGGTPPYTFAWNLGDGTTSSQSSVNHTYTSAGSYSARLTVTDSHGVTSQASVQLTVYPALSISTTAMPAAGEAPLLVGFTASASGGLAPYSYTWGFGDTATAAGSSATHSYGAGEFHPTLTVHDSAGGTWTGVVAKISAKAPPPAPAPPGASNPGKGAGSDRMPGGPPPAAASLAPEQPSPSADPSPSSPASPSARAVQPAAYLAGSGSDRNTALMGTLLGSVVASGLGGYLFLWWRRGRLF